MKIRPVSICLTILLSVLFVNCKKQEDPIVRPDQTKAEIILQEVNKYRLAGCNCGSEYFPPADTLSLNDTLSLAAKNHSMDMDKNNFISHTGSDDTDPSERVSRYNYKWSLVGENNARGDFTEASVVKAWIDSPGHCKNIMNPHYTEMGAGKSGNYWALVFARPYYLDPIGQ